MNAPTKIEPGIMAALAAALPMLEGAKKNSANPHFKSKYADLGSVIDAIRPIAEHGLWFRQVDLEREGGAAVETFYIHKGGEELSAGITFVPADRGNAQGYGSAKTYARRYGLQCAFGLASEDDDGNAAAEAPPKRRTAEGQSKESEVSPPQSNDKPPPWREPDSDLYPTPTKLHKGLTTLERELAGCGDSDMVYALTATHDWCEFVRVADIHAPHYLHGGKPAPPEFKGLLNIAASMVKEFDSAEAQAKADIARA